MATLPPPLSNCAVAPVEVLPAVDLPVPEEALVVEQSPAHLAPDALRVPGLVHEVQQEAVHDGTLAPGAVHRHHGHHGGL